MLATAFDAYDAAFDVVLSEASVKVDELMIILDDAWMDPLTSSAYCGALEVSTLIGQSTTKLDVFDRFTDELEAFEEYVSDAG